MIYLLNQAAQALGTTPEELTALYDSGALPKPAYVLQNGMRMLSTRDIDRARRFLAGEPTRNGTSHVPVPSEDNQNGRLTD